MLGWRVADVVVLLFVALRWFVVFCSFAGWLRGLCGLCIV